jgi:hypothetical protein
MATKFVMGNAGLKNRILPRYRYPSGDREAQTVYFIVRYNHHRYHETLEA